VPPGITIRRLRKTFPTPGGGTTHAVDGVDLDIAPGDLFFLLGPSGCGKTTLLRMIAGFIDPTEGTVRFGDRDVTNVPPNKRNTGMVFQSYALWPHMSVAENVAFGLGVRGVAGEEKARRVAEALGAVRMEAYATRRPNQLSGGQQQRVALARALVVRPDVLLLDEPLSNLDAKLRLELRAEIRRICKGSGITGVYVTHDQKEALSMADRIAVMDRGRIVQIGTPEDLYRRPRDRFVAEFIGETNLLPGRVESRNGDEAVVELKSGKIRASAGPDAPGVGADCLVCVRPEGARLEAAGASSGGTSSGVASSGGTNSGVASSGGTNSLEATVNETTYLGEMAQHSVTLADGSVLKIAELNPWGASRGGSKVVLRVEPRDAVVLPAVEIAK
jgi:iron(III) transport system ATP-binding protein